MPERLGKKDMQENFQKRENNCFCLTGTNGNKTSLPSCFQSPWAFVQGPGKCQLGHPNLSTDRGYPST